jgi:glutathione S-transferase
MSTPVLHYWGIKARGQLAVLVAAYAGKELQWNRQPDWPGLKPSTPFGQLPFLEDGDVKIAQSGAIARYLGRKFGLQGESDADFGQSEQLIEESQDIFTAIAKANYSPNKAEAYTTAFESEIPKHLENLEKLLNGGDKFTSSTTTGELAIFGVLNIALDLQADLLAKYPALQAFYNRIAANAGVAAYLAEAVPAYFKRD